MLTSLKRVFHFAATDFWRNKGISLAAIFILATTILLVTALFYTRGLSSFLVSQVENKIDITAYFKPDTAEESILAVRDDIFKSSPQVKSVDYVSRDQALQSFTQKHQGSDVLNRALNQVGDNPFLPSLNITTSNPSQYQDIAALLAQDKYSSLIDSVDFSQKKDTIEKVFSITQTINRIGLLVGLALVLASLLVVFNTIKLVVDNSRDEIATMKVVGASHWFIKAPFVIEGTMFGLAAFVICLVLTIASSLLLADAIESVLPGFSTIGYFLGNFWLIILLQLIFGAGLGIISSLIVVNRYLKV